MSLKYALLGFLNNESMSGYQLKQLFDKSVRNFWNASLSQIYPTLSQMKDEGLLTSEVEYRESSPNAKIYHITDLGRSELRKWLNEPTKPQQYRNAFLIKIFFGANADINALIAQLQSHLETAENNLENYRQNIKWATDDYNAEGHASPRELFWRLTADFGIKHQEALIAWSKETIEKLKSINQ